MTSVTYQLVTQRASARIYHVKYSVNRLLALQNQNETNLEFNEILPESPQFIYIHFLYMKKIKTQQKQ